MNAPNTRQTASSDHGEGSALRTARFLWVLDNGHARSTSGKRSPVRDDGSQLLEYEFTRDVVARIIAKLGPLGLRHHLLVPELNEDVPVSERARRANQLRSELPKIYLSVHANAHEDKGRYPDGWTPAHGIETWCFGPKGEALGLASAFQRHLIASLNWRDRGVRYHERSRQSAAVLRKTTMPAILTENGFYTHREECGRLMSSAAREQIAQAHVDAMLEVEELGLGALQAYHSVFRITPTGERVALR